MIISNTIALLIYSIDVSVICATSVFRCITYLAATWVINGTYSCKHI